MSTNIWGQYIPTDLEVAGMQAGMGNSYNEAYDLVRAQHDHPEQFDIVDLTSPQKEHTEITNTMSDAFNRTKAESTFRSSSNNIISGINSSLNNATSGITGGIRNNINDLSGTIGGIKGSISNTIGGVSSQINDIKGTLNGIPSTIDNLTSLFSLDKLKSLVTIPLPPPINIKPIKLTDFQISPFIEKVTKDPFSMPDLNILSKAELAVDDVVDYLSNSLSGDVLDGIYNIPDLPGKLLEKATSLEEFVQDIAYKLPNTLSLDGLLRKTGLMTVYNNIDNFTNTISSLGSKLTELPNTFIETGLHFMGKMENTFNLATDTSRFTSMFDKVSNFGGTTEYHPVAMTAIALAHVNELTLKKTNTAQTLTKLGIRNKAKILELTKSIKSDDFITIAAGNKLIGKKATASLITNIKKDGITNTATNLNAIITKFKNSDTTSTLLVPNTIAGVANTINNIHKDNTITLNSILTTHTTEVKTVTEAIAKHGVDVIDHINDTITEHTFTTTLSMVDNILAQLTILDLSDMINVLIEVKNIGVLTYRSTYGVTTHQELLNLVIAYGIDLILILANTIAIIGPSNITNTITSVNTIGNNDINTLVAIANLTTPNILATSTLALASASNIEITDTIAQADLIGANKLANLINAVNILNIENLANLLVVISNNNQNLINDNLDTLSVLTITDILDIAKQMTNTEPYTTILNSGITGDFLQYAAIEAIDLCAKAGDPKMVLDIINRHPYKIPNPIRKLAVTHILKNYKVSEDDNVIGINGSANILGNSLTEIYPNWNMDMRANNDINTLAPLITANTDSLQLLTHYPNAAISAILQLDNNYKIY